MDDEILLKIGEELQDLRLKKKTRYLGIQGRGKFGKTKKKIMRTGYKFRVYTINKKEKLKFH